MLKDFLDTIDKMSDAQTFAMIGFCIGMTIAFEFINKKLNQKEKK